VSDDHVHRWTPVQGECGQYECECGTSGYRVFSGWIREHKTPKPRRVATTARSRMISGGRVAAAICEDWQSPDKDGDK
jgi:hypothetical protein